MAPQSLERQSEHEECLAFARRNYLGFEIPDFKYAQHLISENHDGNYEKLKKWQQIQNLAKASAHKQKC